MDLTELRREIDEIDKELTELLEKRMAVAEKVALYKLRSGKPVLDSGREKEVLEKASGAVQSERYKPYILDILSAVMAESRSMQEMLMDVPNAMGEQKAAGGAVAYCGIPGSYAEEAAICYFGGEARLLEQNTFEDVVKSVLTGQAAYGLLPVENSSSGAVAQVEDILYQNDVFITGEWILPVKQHLLGVSGAAEADIRTVTSHPQGIEQCQRYIAEHGFAVRLSGNTAFAARDVAKEGDRSVAAIASERAAAIYNLDILKRNIQTSVDNYTRFVVIENALKEEGDKISIVSVIPHKAGSLYTLLSVFAGHGLNLLKLLARPIAESAWHYRFHFDVSGSLRDENVRAAIEEAKKLCDSFKITGCYKAAGRL
jgi:chorismate mutase/prephenate dehydratase